MLELLDIIRNLVPSGLARYTEMSPYPDTRFIVQQTHRNPMLPLPRIEIRHR